MSRQQEPISLESLAGQVAVITGGGNNGIGWGLAAHAAGVLGMHVAIVDLHETLVTDAANQLRQQFPEVESIGIQADVTSESSMAACLDAVDRTFPGKPIGALFANAGVIFNHTIARSALAEWSTTLNVNVLGVVNTVKTFLPRLQEQAFESILCTTASIGGLVRGDGGGAAYQASKHAVVALTESLSFELARRNPQIHVHVLCPCIVASALGETSRVNADVLRGETNADTITPRQPGNIGGLAMRTADHAQQVFDHIAAGHFYMITDNVRPYVDHDFPFDGLGIVRERVDNLMTLTIDNADAFIDGPHGPPSSILKGPMWQEIKRRSRPK